MRTQVIGGIVTATAAAAATYYGGYYAGAAVAAVGAGTCAWIIKSTKGLDDLGSQSWQANYWDMQKRVDFTHKADFLATRTAPGAVKTLPFASGGTGTPETWLLHPVVGYGRTITDTTPQCGPPTSYGTCATGNTCYINQSLANSSGARENTITWSGPFVPANNDYLYRIGYAGRYHFSRDGGRYKADFDFTMCPQGSTSPRCTQ